MMEYLEHKFRNSGDPADQERADILRVMRRSRGFDIDIPFNSTLAAKNQALETELNKLRRLLGLRRARQRIEHQLSGFGAELRSIRVKLGFTQIAFADRVPMDQSTLSKLEAERRPINEQLLESICSSHQLTPDQIRRLYSLAGFNFEPPMLLR